MKNNINYKILSTNSDNFLNAKDWLETKIKIYKSNSKNNIEKFTTKKKEIEKKLDESKFNITDASNNLIHLFQDHISALPEYSNKDGLTPATIDLTESRIFYNRFSEYFNSYSNQMNEKKIANFETNLNKLKENLNEIDESLIDLDTNDTKINLFKKTDQEIALEIFLTTPNIECDINELVKLLQSKYEIDLNEKTQIKFGLIQKDMHPVIFLTEKIIAEESNILRDYITYSYTNDTDGDIKKLTALLESNCNTEVKDNKLNQTPLETAIKYNDKKLIELFKENNAEYPKISQITEYDNEIIANILDDNGWEIDKQIENGNTQLMLDIQNNNLGNIFTLLLLQASLKIINHSGKTAIECTKNEELNQFLANITALEREIKPEPKLDYEDLNKEKKNELIRRFVLENKENFDNIFNGIELSNNRTLKNFLESLGSRLNGLEFQRKYFGKVTSEENSELLKAFMDTRYDNIK